MLHLDSAVKEIDRYVEWGEVDEQPQVATELRFKHLALQLDKKQRLERSPSAPVSFSRSSGD